MATRPKANLKQITVQSATEKVATVGMGKNFSVNIPTLNGSTVNVIGYALSAEEATRRNITRTQHILDEAITAPYSKANIGPMEEVGIDVTAYVGDVSADILLSSRATSG